MRKKRLSDKRKIDLIVAGVCIYFIVFVIVAWITYYIKGDVPDSLVQYGLGGGAFFSLVLICILRRRFCGN